MIFKNIRCCNICLVKTNCVEACDKYNSIMSPLKPLIKITEYICDKFPMGRIDDKIVQPTAVFFVSIIVIPYYFIFVERKTPGFANYIISIQDQRISGWIDTFRR